MKIEVGKFYKTRDGCKVRIYELNAIEDGQKIVYGDQSIHGAILGDRSDGQHSMNIWFAGNWELDGSWLSGQGHHNDIISEWEELKPRLYAYRRFTISSYEDPIYEVFMSTNSELRGATRLPHLDEPEEK